MSVPYRADIDGLRAIAILMVVAFHAFPQAVPGGFIGVDVFFVISGYLITTILRQELQGHARTLVGFYARRVLRIFPALVLVLFFCLIVGWYTLLASEYKQLGKHVALGAAFLSNLGLWLEAGYFDRASDAKPLLHLWSLAIEEQFYICWPLLVWSFQSARKNLITLTTILTVVSMTLSVWWVWTNPSAAFYSPLTRTWELMAGALLAMGGDFFRFNAKSPSRIFAIVVLIISSLTLNSKMPFPGLLALLAILPTILLLVAPAERDITDRILGNPWMTMLGKVSYPWYLWHWPLISFAHIIDSGQATTSLRGWLAILSLVLAVLTYRLWEIPIRKISRFWAVAFLVGMMLFAGLLGKNIFDRDGLERIRHKEMISLGDSERKDFVDFEKQGLIRDATCEKPFLFPEKKVCLIARPQDPVTAVLLGDSHAIHAFWGLARAFDKRGFNLAVRGKGACVPILTDGSGVQTPACSRHMDLTLHEISNDTSVREVALVFRGRYLTVNATDMQRAEFENGLEATLRLLDSAGKRIYYFLPVVEPGFDPRLCVGSLPFGRRPPYSCVIEKANNDTKSEPIRTIASRVLERFPKVILVDPNTAFCANDKCPIIQNSHSIFKDDNHLSWPGSLMLSTIFQDLSLRPSTDAHDVVAP